MEKYGDIVWTRRDGGGGIELYPGVQIDLIERRHNLR
jgi:hypothetical protein